MLVAGEPCERVFYSDSPAGRLAGVAGGLLAVGGRRRATRADAVGGEGDEQDDAEQHVEPLDADAEEHEALADHGGERDAEERADRPRRTPPASSVPPRIGPRNDGSMNSWPMPGVNEPVLAPSMNPASAGQQPRQGVHGDDPARDGDRREQRGAHR